MDVSWSLTRAERPVPSWLSMRVRWPGWDCERRDDPLPLPAHVGKLFFLCRRRHAAATGPRSRQRCSGLSASADPRSVRYRRCPFRPCQSPPARTSAGPPLRPFLPGESGLRRAVQPFLTLVRATRRHGQSSAHAAGHINPAAGAGDDEDPRVTQHETCGMTSPAISSIWRRSSPTGQKWTRWHPARA